MPRKINSLTLISAVWAIGGVVMLWLYYAGGTRDSTRLTFSLAFVALAIFFGSLGRVRKAPPTSDR